VIFPASVCYFFPGFLFQENTVGFDGSGSSDFFSTVILFFYDPHIKSIVNLGAAANIQYWLIATPVLVAFVGVLFIGTCIGWTMVTTPPPKPLEEITTETVDKTE
jgi:hypothetical protein